NFRTARAVGAPAAASCARPWFLCSSVVPAARSVPAGNRPPFPDRLSPEAHWACSAPAPKGGDTAGEGRAPGAPSRAHAPFQEDPQSRPEGRLGSPYTPPLEDGVLVRAVHGWYRQRTRRAGSADGYSGSVTVISTLWLGPAHTGPATRTAATRVLRILIDMA